MGVAELLILLTIILLVFGAKRVPQLGRSLGKGIREFRKGVAEAQSDADDDAVEMQAHETKGGKKASPSEAVHSVASDVEGAETPPTGHKP